MSPSRPYFARKHADRVRRLILPEDKLTIEQRTLRVLCRIMLAWSLLSLVAEEALLLLVQTPLFAMPGNPELLLDFLASSMLPCMTFFINLIYAFLGFIGVRTPSKITPFFAIAFLCALLGGWDLASRISLGTASIPYAVEVIFVIATAYLAWQVKKTTYPEDWYEQKEAAKARRRNAKRKEKEGRRQERLLKKQLKQAETRENRSGQQE